MDELQLNLSELAREHFALDTVEPDRLTYAVVHESIQFAMCALTRYQELWEEHVRVAFDQSTPPCAQELVNVVELNRSLRGRSSTAGDLWQAISYLLERNLPLADWKVLMQELEELALN